MADSTQSIDSQFVGHTFCECAVNYWLTWNNKNECPAMSNINLDPEAKTHERGTKSSKVGWNEAEQDGRSDHSHLYAFLSVNEKARLRSAHRWPDIWRCQSDDSALCHNLSLHLTAFISLQSDGRLVCLHFPFLCLSPPFNLCWALGFSNNSNLIFTSSQKERKKWFILNSCLEESVVCCHFHEAALSEG